MLRFILCGGVGAKGRAKEDEGENKDIKKYEKK